MTTLPGDNVGEKVKALREKIGDHPYEYYIEFQKKKKEEMGIKSKKDEDSM